jgi:hypothetical protein
MAQDAPSPLPVTWQDTEKRDTAFPSAHRTPRSLVIDDRITPIGSKRRPFKKDQERPNAPAPKPPHRTFETGSKEVLGVGDTYGKIDEVREALQSDGDATTVE